METKAEVWIPLTQGKVAVIDFDDFEKVRGLKWYAYQNARGENNAWYARRNVAGGTRRQQTQLLHRFLTDSPPDKQVLHKDGNGLNCRQENLLHGTALENARGPRLRCPSFSSRFRGVSWCGIHKKWKARIVVNLPPMTAKRHSLGYHNDELQAAKAYDAAALKYFGKNAPLNFPAQKEIQCLPLTGIDV